MQQYYGINSDGDAIYVAMSKQEVVDYAEKHPDEDIVRVEDKKGNGYSLASYKQSLTEDLKKWDKKEFRDNSNCYELEMLYESNKTMLSSQQKNELSRFVRKAKTAEEINTYMTGMLAQSTNESLTEETAQERTARRFQEIEADNERKRKEIEQNYERWNTLSTNPNRPKEGDTVWVMSGGKRPGGVDPIKFEKRKSAGGGFYYGEDGTIREWHNIWKEKE